MKREDLLKSREYWISKIQIDLFNLIESYRTDKGLNKTELAAELGCTKGYVTQILNGDFDHKVSKLVDLSLAFGKVPNIDFIALEDYMNIMDNENANTVTLSFVRDETTETYDFNEVNNTDSEEFPSEYKFAM